MKRLALLAVLVVAWGLAGAQDKIYRCGTEYFNGTPEEMAARGCKLLEGEKGIASEKKPSKAPRKVVDPVIKSVDDAKLLYPFLKGLDDDQVVDALHRAFYSDLPREQIASALGVRTTTPKILASPAVQASGIVVTNENPNDYVGGRWIQPVATGPQSVADQPARPGRDVAGSIVFFGLLAFGLTGYFWMRSVEKSKPSTSTSLPNEKILGIHGWLRFFITSLGILGPALSLGRVAANFRDDEMVYAALASVPAWATYKTVAWLTLALFSAFSIYAALKLRFVWKPASVTLAKIAVVSWPVCNLVVGVVIPLVVFGNEALSLDPKFAGSFLALIISTVVWLVYLSRSKRVGATYSGDLVHSRPAACEVSQPSSPGEQAPPVNSTASQTSAGPAGNMPMMETEEALYEKVGQELDAGNTHKATWLKAFAEADGDGNVAKARYIKYRMEQLLPTQGS